MKWVFLLLCASLGNAFTQWYTDFEAVKKEARVNNRLILLNFSGSDWCGPCMRLKEDVFNSEEFCKLADSSLVLCNADFPRNKKNQLPAALQKSNGDLADAYNPSGKFPFTVLLTADGKVLRCWDGYPQSNSKLFINQLKATCDANSDR